MEEIDKAKERGCDHAVAVGWGETALYNHINEFVGYAKEIGMTSSIITNGTLPIKKYETLYNAGLNHLHVSVHGFGDTLNKIADSPVASDRQKELLEWLKNEGKPFRTNTTLQKLNYRELPEIISQIKEYGAFHVVLLGFLPHYHWSLPDKMKEVAVHPADLRLKIEKSCKILEEANVYCTVRYHPFCHLDKKHWKYVTNALYVLFDPWEWDYGHCGENKVDFNRSAVNMATCVSIKNEPCTFCDAAIHCGRWNATYAKGFDGAGLKAVRITNPEERNFGYYFEQNPINQLKGWI